MTDLERVELAPGYSIARIINGCWQLTSDHGGGPGSGKASLDRFAELVEHGFTTFDCADIYEGTEALLGRFRAGLDDPDRIQVHTKLVPDKARLAVLNDDMIDAVIERSRRRLRVDTIDLVQFHWWDYAVPGVERVYDRLLSAQSKGRIRLIGVTNFDTPHLEALVNRNPAIVSMQAQYSLLDRRPERRMSAYCENNGVGILAYGALAGGFLSNRYLGAAPLGSLNRSLTKYRLIIDEAGGWPRLQALLETLDSIATRHKVGIDTVAARWVLDRPGVAAVILGIGSRPRADSNRRIPKLSFDDEDRERLRKALDTMTIPTGEPYELERDPDGIHAGIIRTNLQDAEAGT